MQRYVGNSWAGQPGSAVTDSRHGRPGRGGPGAGPVSRTGDEGHDQDLKPRGIPSSIPRPGVPCPDAVLVVVILTAATHSWAIHRTNQRPLLSQRTPVLSDSRLPRQSNPDTLQTRAPAGMEPAPTTARTREHSRTWKQTQPPSTAGHDPRRPRTTDEPRNPTDTASVGAECSVGASRAGRTATLDAPHPSPVWPHSSTKEPLMTSRHLLSPDIAAIGPGPRSQVRQRPARLPLTRRPICGDHGCYQLLQCLQ
jgi:hypothetical protein